MKAAFDKMQRARVDRQREEMVDHIQQQLLPPADNNLSTDANDEVVLTNVKVCQRMVVWRDRLWGRGCSLLASALATIFVI